VLERTFFMIKPDGVSRGLTEEIKNRLKFAGIKIAAEKEFLMDVSQAEKLYAVHRDKDFYPGLIKLITSGPVVTLLLEADGAVAKVRKLMGATDPREAAQGTIRGDLKEGNIFTEYGIIKNLVHGSDSPQNAEYEAKIFF